MSSTGLTNYSVTELDVATAILSKIGVLEDGQTPSNSDIQVVRRNLNMIYKQWTAQADFAPGLKMWTRRRAYLFLQPTQIQYDLGPNGDECAAESYVSTTLSATSGATATLTSVTGVASGMRIGIKLSTGSFSWTTIASLAGPIATLTAPIAASSGSLVFLYTAKPVKPFEILSAALRDSAGNDSFIDPHLSVDEYEQIGTKSALGTPIRLYYEAKKDACRVFIDVSPDDVTKVIRLVFYSYIEDTAAQTDDVDFPAEWFRALVGQGALDSALDFSRPITPDLKLFRDEGLAMARNAHPSTTSAFYASEPDWY